jgi:hypothetical protein
LFTLKIIGCASVVPIKLVAGSVPALPVKNQPAFGVIAFHHGSGIIIIIRVHCLFDRFNRPVAGETMRFAAKTVIRGMSMPCVVDFPFQIR